MRLWAIRLLVFVALLADGMVASAQSELTDSIVTALDSMYQSMPTDTALIAEKARQEDKQTQNIYTGKTTRNWSDWRPDPQRALWLALVIPGGGQIYNRKYWKLPIVYGGFVGCIYAMNWNNMMYKDYAQAYLDIMDNDPTTQSYNKFMHLGRQITSANEERYKTIFKKRKDRYRRWRDMSFFVMLGIYAVSVIDAYVDAELSEFDLSNDLSLRVTPALIPSADASNIRNPLYATSVGVNCSINF